MSSDDAAVFVNFPKWAIQQAQSLYALIGQFVQDPNFSLYVNFCSHVSPLLVTLCPDFEGRPSKHSYLQARLNDTSYLVSLKLTETFIFKVLIVFFALCSFEHF